MAIQELPPTIRCISGSSPVSMAQTFTLPAVATGHHYITAIELVQFAVAGLLVGTAPVLVTTTNIPGNVSFALSASAMAQGTLERFLATFTNAIRSSIANTPTTIICPAVKSIIWHVNIFYYLGI